MHFHQVELAGQAERLRAEPDGADGLRAIGVVAGARVLGVVVRLGALALGALIARLAAPASAPSAAGVDPLVDDLALVRERVVGPLALHPLEVREPLAVDDLVDHPYGDEVWDLEGRLDVGGHDGLGRSCGSAYSSGAGKKRPRP